MSISLLMARVRGEVVDGIPCYGGCTLLPAMYHYEVWIWSLQLLLSTFECPSVPPNHPIGHRLPLPKNARYYHPRENPGYPIEVIN